MSFRNRADAGRQLAASLLQYRGRSDVCVLALPRGGVPVAREVASALGVPLDVLAVRRLVAPSDGGQTIGAVAGGGVRVVDEDLCHALCVPDDVLAQIAQREQAEVERRDRLYHECIPKLDVRGKTVILVDDGIATGASMCAAVLSLEEGCAAAAVVVAVPVASFATHAELTPRVREFVYGYIRDPVYAVGLWYDDYPAVSDDEVCRILRTANAELAERSRQPSVPRGASVTQT